MGELIETHGGWVEVDVEVEKKNNKVSTWQKNATTVKFDHLIETFSRRRLLPLFYPLGRYFYLHVTARESEYHHSGGCGVGLATLLIIHLHGH